MKLYLYEHCPFCVRPRLVADLKSLNIPLTIFANDDEQSHFDLVGKKIVPILQKDDGTHMTESLDICHVIDASDGNSIILPSNNNQKINQLVSEIANTSKYLTHPRQIFHPMNQEDFPTQSAQDYFRKKKEASIEMTFEAAIKNSDTFAQPVQALLEQLDPYFTHRYATGDSFTEDDVIIFPILRTLTIALDTIHIPKNILQYLEFIQSKTKIKLYTTFDFKKALNA